MKNCGIFFLIFNFAFLIFNCLNIRQLGWPHKIRLSFHNNLLSKRQPDQPSRFRSFAPAGYHTGICLYRVNNWLQR